jgi:anti-anti-sigma factor
MKKPPDAHADTPKIEESGGVRVITLTSGKVREAGNVIAGELEGRTGGLAAGRHVLIDLTHVERISSVEPGTLVGLHKRVAASGGRLTLFNLSPLVFEVFAVTRLDTFLTICRENGGETR